MMCGQAKELIAASWTGELDAQEEFRLRQHLSGCAECAGEMSQLSALWERLPDVPSPEPSPELNARWRATLGSLLPRRSNGFAGFSRVWQGAAAAACLAAGFAIGYQYPHGGSDIARLREEVAATKQLVALSLLQQESATERLRGVDYSVNMRALDPEVVASLVQAVKNDSSVNVRLAAIDALARVSGDARVRQSLEQSIGRQDSPMVQAALIDYALDARDRQAAEPLRQLAARSDLNPAIRERAESAVKRLTEYR